MVRGAHLRDTRCEVPGAYLRDTRCEVPGARNATWQRWACKVFSYLVPRTSYLEKTSYLAPRTSYLEKSIPYFLLLFLPLFAHAQTEQVDSLLRVFDRQPTVETANRFFTIINKEELFDEPISMKPATPADTLRQQVWYWASEYYQLYQHYEQGVHYGLKALPLCEKSGDVGIEGDCLTAITINYYRMGDFDKAINYAKRCNELDLKTGNADNIASSFNSMAAIFVSAHQYDEAEKCVLRGLDYCRKADNPPRLAILTGMACEIYNNMRRYDVALTYGEQALEMEQKMQNTSKIPVRQSQLSETLMGLGRYSEAKELLSQAIPGLRQSKNYHSLGIACNQMGRLLLHEDKTAEAVTYFDEALQIFVEQKDIFNESRSRRGLYEALRETDPKLAMQHNDRYNLLRDSIFDDQTRVLLTQYSAQLGNERLLAEKEELRHRHTRNIALAVAVFLLLAVVTWAFSYRRARRHHRRIAELTGEIALISQQVTQIKEDTAHKKPDFNDRQFLIEVISLVNEAMRHGPFSVEDIAKKMSLSPTTLRRRLQQVTGETPKAYITAIQMQHAATLLQQGNYSVNEVAEKCGFNEPSSFTRTFKRTYGVAPSQYVPPTVAEETEQPNPEET